MPSLLAQSVRWCLALVAITSVLSSQIPGTSATVNEKRSTEQANSVTAGNEKMKLSRAYGNLPLSFEPNKGQADDEVKFVSRGKGYTLYLEASEAVLALRSVDQKSDKPSTGLKVVRMKLVDSNANPTVNGEEQLQGKSNYLVGENTSKWRKDIPTYRRVKYDDVYPGIDLVYYGTNQRELEYDFHVAAGADPNQIKLEFSGAEKISVDEDGNLALQVGNQQVVQHAPVIYQQNGEIKQNVEGKYVLHANNEVGFQIGSYDQTKPLVIDPRLVYATAYGGTGNEFQHGIAVDPNGNTFITGHTTSIDIPLKNPFQDSHQGDGFDVFVVKMNPAGSDIVYATYLGSTNASDEAGAIAITSDGKACVTGTITNFGSDSDFPTTANRYQGNGVSTNGVGRDYDVFVTQLNKEGNGLLYSTFFGGKDSDFGKAIAVDGSNRIYITGRTKSPNFPTKNAFQDDLATDDVDDAFIAKFNTSLSGNNSLVYSSFLGGGGGEEGFAIAVTPGGVAFFGGVTGSFDFPTKSSSSLPPFQQTQGGVNDGFLAKVGTNGGLIYSTYFGGNNLDAIHGIAVDTLERTYLTGVTSSSAATFPLRNAFDSGSSASEAFVAKFNADGTALFYSSFLGVSSVNTQFNSGPGIAIDAQGNAYLTGGTNLPGAVVGINGFPSSIVGTAYVAKVGPSNATGTSVPRLLLRDTFGGGTANANAIGIDKRGNIYIAGDSRGGFPTTPGAFQQPFQGGAFDAFIVKIASTFPDTIGVFRAQTGQFLLRNSNTAGPPDQIIEDGIDDVGVFDPQTTRFQLLAHNVLRSFSFGQRGGIPIAGDWDGDGFDSVGVFRNGRFQLTNDVNSPSPLIDFDFAFGQATDRPTAGDWNGDGIDTIGAVRPEGSTLTWFLRNSNSAGGVDQTFIHGGSGVGSDADLLSPGDFAGSGADTAGVWRIQTDEFFLLDGVGPLPVVVFGQLGDLPVTGDWDGRL
jgi:hypothetical protein